VLRANDGLFYKQKPETSSAVRLFPDARVLCIINERWRITSSRRPSPRDFTVYGVVSCVTCAVINLGRLNYHTSPPPPPPCVHGDEHTKSVFRVGVFFNHSLYSRKCRPYTDNTVVYGFSLIFACPGPFSTNWFFPHKPKQQSCVQCVLFFTLLKIELQYTCM